MHVYTMHSKSNYLANYLHMLRLGQYLLIYELLVVLCNFLSKGSLAYQWM